MGPADRRPDPQPPARGSRRRAAQPDPELPDRAGLRAGDDRPRSGLSRLPGRPRPPGPDAGAALDRRSAAPRLDRPASPLAGSLGRGPRSARRRDIDQQCLDRPPRHVRLAALPAGRRHRAGDRPHPARPGPAPRGPAQGRPPRQPDIVDRRVSGRRPSPGGDRLGRRGQPVWPSRARDPGPDRGPWCPAVPDRSQRDGGGDPRWPHARDPGRARWPRNRAGGRPGAGLPEPGRSGWHQPGRRDAHGVPLRDRQPIDRRPPNGSRSDVPAAGRSRAGPSGNTV